MSISNLCQELYQKASSSPEVRVTKDDMNFYSQNTVRVEFAKFLSRAQKRRQYVIATDGNDLVITNKGAEDQSPELAQSQQLFTSIITRKHNKVLMTCYKLLITEEIVETIEVQGLNEQDVQTLYSEELSGLELAPTKKGVLILWSLLKDKSVLKWKLRGL